MDYTRLVAESYLLSSFRFIEYLPLEESSNILKRFSNTSQVVSYVFKHCSKRSQQIMASRVIHYEKIFLLVDMWKYAMMIQRNNQLAKILIGYEIIGTWSTGIVMGILEWLYF